MCGTSQDALDVAEVSFREDGGKWSHQLHWHEAFPLPDELAERLRHARTSTAFDLLGLDIEFGRFSGSCVRSAQRKHASEAKFIGSHGVTIFHEPSTTGTLQIGSGSEIAAATGLPTVVDFRSQDVAKGGQGAPLVPGADAHLFADFASTLNLGGFANVSLLQNHLTGFDVGPCNLLLNWLSNEQGKPFDDGGRIARSGNLIVELLETLNNLEFYGLPAPKSVGVEWFEASVQPCFQAYSTFPIADRLHTAVEHIAFQVAIHLNATNDPCLVAGGGALNDYLIERISLLSEAKLVLPNEDIIHSKEAVCFAFLGLLRILERPNVYASVTGASEDSCAGSVYLP